MATKDAAERVTRLEALLAEQQAQGRRLEGRIAELEVQLRTAVKHSRPVQKRLVSRAGLLKGAAAGVAGLAAAELSGSLGATPAAATTTDTNLVATGGSGTGVQVGGQSATDYGYTFGGFFYGNAAGVAGAAVDGSGKLDNGDGVRGLSGSGNGVIGISHSGIGGNFSGGSAAVWFVPTASPGPPTSGTHNQGEIMVDANGVPYTCSAGDGSTIGAWQAIGNLRSFPNPRRVFGAPVGNGSSYGPVDATKKLNGTASGVPAGASAVYAAVQSDQPGRLTLYPDGTTDPGIANWTNNGTPGSLFLTYMLIPLPTTAAFRIHSYLTGNVYVDAWGYLL